MNHYASYMDHVSLTPEEHAALLAALTRPEPAPKSNMIQINRFAALAACCALILVGAWGFGWQPGPSPASAYLLPTSAPTTAAPPPSTVTADPKAKVYNDPADPEASTEVHTDPGLTSQPPAVVLPHVELPTITEEGQTEYTIPSRDVSTHPIEMDTATLPPPSTALTLDACRAAPVYGSHIPTQVPSRFTFASGSSAVGDAGADTLSARWEHGMETLQISLTHPAQAPAIMDVSDPARYDVRLYPIPWADSVPEDIMFGGFQDPVFRYEDLTEEVIAARGVSVSDSGDVGGLRFIFSVLYPDGVVARYTLKGLTMEEATALVLE